MRLQSTTALLLILSACAAGTQSQQIASAEQETVTGQILVTGEARVEVEPDTVVLKGRLFERADTRDDVLRSISSLNETVTKTIPAFEGLDYSEFNSNGLEIETIRAQGCSTRLYGNASVPENCDPLAYTGVLTFTIKARPADIGGDLVSYLAEIGAEEVSVSGFEVTDSDDYKAEAERLAVADALEKARGLAEVTNSNLGKIIELNDGTLPSMNMYRTPPPPPPPPPPELPAVADFYSSSPIMAAETISIEPEKEAFDARVVLRVEIIPAD